MTDWCSFDLEIYDDLGPEGKYAHQGISCAAIAFRDEFETEAHVEKFGLSNRMSMDGAQEMLDTLCRLSADGFRIVTWNGLSFDWRVLAIETATMQVSLLSGSPQGGTSASFGGALADDRASHLFGPRPALLIGYGSGVRVMLPNAGTTWSQGTIGGAGVVLTRVAMPPVTPSTASRLFARFSDVACGGTCAVISLDDAVRIGAPANTGGPSKSDELHGATFLSPPGGTEEIGVMWAVGPSTTTTLNQTGTTLPSVASTSGFVASDPNKPPARVVIDPAGTAQVRTLLFAAGTVLTLDAPVTVTPGMAVQFIPAGSALWQPSTPALPGSRWVASTPIKFNSGVYATGTDLLVKLTCNGVRPFTLERLQLVFSDAQQVQG